MSFEKFVTALLSGAAVGLCAALLHFFFVQDLIIDAERYESGEAVHFAAADPAADPAAHPAPAETQDHTHAEGDAAHSHGSAETTPMARNAMTVIFTLFTWCGFALLLAGAMQIARHYGHQITPLNGVLWGLAGFATFSVAPTLGLAPELPGSMAADLTARQIWWLGAVLATAAGLGVLAFGKPALAIGGIVLLVLPHLIGAPHLGSYGGVAPPELGAEFAARTLGAGFINWALLGWVLARFGRQAA